MNPVHKPVTPRERVRAALAHQLPDRVPRLLYEETIGYTPAIARLLQERCRSKTPCDYFNMDITRVIAAPTRLLRERFTPWLGESAHTLLANNEVDEWGVVRRPGDFHHFSRIWSPLRNVTRRADLDHYPWPDLNQEYRFEQVRQAVEFCHTQGMAVAASAGSVFERSWYLRGFEQLMLDLLETPDIAHSLFAITAAFQKSVAEHFARAGVDIVILGDDVATQRALMMRLGTWREFLKPHLARTAQAIKAANPNSFVFYHSDGNIEALIPDLIEVGVEILNPIQPECMNPKSLKQRYGEWLSFWGTVSVQRTMPFGSPEEVRAEVRARIRDVGARGGLILSPAHVLSPEVPWENIVAFFEAASEPI